MSRVVTHKTMWLATILGVAGAYCNAAFAQTINVSTAAELQNAVATANSAGGNRTISLANGTYTLTDTLYVNAPNVSITGPQGGRQNVVIQGDAMSSTARVGSLIRVAANNFQLSNVTLQKSKYHLVQVAGETNADSPVIRDCILRDAYEQMIKVSVNVSDTSVASDNGLVENCIFEYSAGIGPQYYIGGIDAHGAKNWTVRGNTFRNIASPSGSVAEFAVHFWTNSSNNTVERNLIINCDRGIGFGLSGRPNNGGTIRNNMIFHSNNGHQYADTGIGLEESPNTRVYNNTIFFQNSFPWAIEYRFASTQNVQIVNNLTNKPITSRDGGAGTVGTNVTNAAASWFANTSSAPDLHLANTVASVVDVGQAVTGLTNDFDGQARPNGSGIDIGADEFGAATLVPNPPTNVTAQ